MSKKLLTGVILGAAAGAALGILFAPEKGKDTRKKIAKKSTDLSDSVRNKFNELGEALREKYQSIKGDAESMVEKGKETAKDFKEQAKDFKDDTKRNYV
ncbi:MAG: YtxH domain-containing protein [Ferruginibacter sp.]